MKALVVEDDFTSRTLIQEILKPFGSIHVAVDGKEAVTAVRMALEANEPYGLICLDIMLPNMDGQETLRRVRDLEAEYHVPAGRGAKIVMTTALSDMKNVAQAYSNLCDGYLIKPIEKHKLLVEIQKFGLLF
jgi:two-component system, chemotaxis family, chemotaxis protein CheY